ncbi:MAG: serine hydrolase domain-containing protein [Ilumatobacteraceae bacterium]
MTVNGLVEDGWQGVRDAFEANLASNDETGAAVAVYHRGHKVVDLCGGDFDASGASAYDDQTLQLVFSTTKGVTAIALAMCVQRGLIDYDAKVSRYWPEFAEHGKGDATVAQLVSHQCGLIAPDGPLTLADALDWDTITARLAATKPDWPIGSGHGYHAVTFGWLAGELIRRVDPQGRTPGRFVADEISGPLGLEMWIGLPEQYESRVSPLISRPADQAVDPAMQAMIDQFMGPDSRGGRALFLNGALAGDGMFNRRDVHAAEIPAANCITNASSLAKLYAATMGTIDGVQLLEEDTRNRVRATVTPAGEPDLCLMMPTTFGMGVMTYGQFTPFAGAGSYGHPGAGGSVACAQPERQLAFGYVMNTMAQNLAGDVRAQNLLDAATAAADASR